MTLASRNPADRVTRTEEFAPAFERGVSLPCRASVKDVPPSALLPIGGIDGPVVLSCGTRDAALPSSCAWQAAVASTRADVGTPSSSAVEHAMATPWKPRTRIATSTGDETRSLIESRLLRASLSGYDRAS